jgi:hypothetical protein
MQKLDELMTDLNFLLQKGSIKANEVKKQETIYQPNTARYRLLIYFNNKNTGTWLHSFDNQHYNNEVHIDEFNSLHKLIRKVLTDYKNLYKHAIIYANLDEQPNVKSNNYNTEIIIFNKLGQVKQNSFFEVKTIGKNSRLNLDILIGHKKIEQKDFEFIEF